MSTVIVGSAAFAMYWTLHLNAIEDATVAGWFDAIYTLIPAVPIIRRYPTCTFWETKNWGLDSCDGPDDAGV